MTEKPARAADSGRRSYEMTRPLSPTALAIGAEHAGKEVRLVIR